MGRKGGYYAVRTGRKTGIFQTWAECESYVKGFPGARYKKFSTEDEAETFVSGSGAGSYSGYSTGSAPYESRKRTFYEMSDNNTNDNTYTSGYSSYSNPRGTKYYKPSSSWTSWSSSSSSSSDEASSSASRPVVYTDGCCTQNGRNGARAGIGVYWGPDNTRNVSDRLEGEQTNQRAEIMAAVKALETAKDLGYKSLEIKTDSKYTINGATDWSTRWKKNGWKTINGTEVKNKNEFQKLNKLCDEIDVKWTHVPGHQGVAGNEAADSLARTGSKK
ncbi:hypothetical protein ACROYT_G008881 [Oculina patagonica]